MAQSGSVSISSVLSSFSLRKFPTSTANFLNDYTEQCVGTRFRCLYRALQKQFVAMLLEDNDQAMKSQRVGNSHPPVVLKILQPIVDLPKSLFGGLLSCRMQNAAR